MENLEQEIFKLISKQFDVDEKDIRLDSNFVTDLGGDSLDLVEFIVDIEDKFGIVVPDESTEKITTVGEALTQIRALVQKA